MKKMIFLLLLLAFFTFALACEDSGDCIEGYCHNNLCVNPEIGDKIISMPCQTTADCIEGYCISELGRCIIPIESDKIIDFGFKSGCTGIVNCFDDNIICLVLCNLIWIILIILSALAAYFSKDYNNKLVPVFAFILPIFVALAGVAFAGIIVAVIELMILTYYKKKAEKEKIPEKDTSEYLPPLRKTEEY